MKSDAAFTISYLLLVHKNPDQVLRLVNQIDDTDVFFYVHIDKNVDKTPFTSLLKDRKNIYFIQDTDRTVCKWGEISLVTATITLMKAALLRNRPGMLYFLSGQDYPLKHKSEIKQFLYAHRNCNFIGSEKLPVDRWEQGGFSRFNNYNFVLQDQGSKLITLPTFWTLHRNFYRKLFLRIFQYPALLKANYKLFFQKRKLPDQLYPHGNSQWWALPYSTASFLVKYLDNHPEVLYFFKYCRYPDEHIFHTIFSSKKHLLQLQQDMPILTFIDWQQPQKGNPAIFREDDLPNLLRQSCLFARKFDISINARILDLLDANV